MSDLRAAPDQPEPASPTPPRRVVTDWEYQTAYLPTLQVRLTVDLHHRLCEWAEERRVAPGDIAIEALEEAVGRRTSSGRRADDAPS